MQKKLARAAAVLGIAMTTIPLFTTVANAVPTIFRDSHNNVYVMGQSLYPLWLVRTELSSLAGTLEGQDLSSQCTNSGYNIQDNYQYPDQSICQFCIGFLGVLSISEGCC